MATITTRSGKGSPLTNTELDANFTNLNTDKQEVLAEGSFADGDKTKLDGIESGATADQTAQEIATAIDADATAESTLKSALGLGTAAYTASTDYATAAQGALADSALQSIPDNYVLNTGDAITGNLTFGDNDKAIFGAGSDLQIYHDGSNSIVNDSGTGSLLLQGNNLYLQNAAGTEYYVVCLPNEGVNLRYDNAIKLATTSTGIDVTGTVTADGLTVDTGAIISTTYGGTNGAGRVQFGASGAAYITGQDDGYGGSGANITMGIGSTNHLKIATNGDISFYEDTGTTAKFFWDASAESLGIGTTSPSYALDVNGGSTTTPIAHINTTNTGNSVVLSLDSSSGFAAGGGTRMRFGRHTQGANSVEIGYDHDTAGFQVTRNGVDLMTIASSGNVGIKTVPSAWNTFTASLQIDGASLSGLGANNTALGSNLYYNSGWKYYGTGNASLYQQNSGLHRWDIAGSGTAGNAATLTEAMRIDSSGRVGIGTSSPSGKLHTYIDANAQLIFQNSSQNNLYLSGTNASVVIDATGSVYPSFIVKTQGSLNGSIGGPGSTASGLSFGNASGEAMRIDSSGNLLVGKTSASKDTVGAELKADGRINATMTSNVPILANRKTSDGDIVLFQKDGTTVGSIGVGDGDNLYITGSSGSTKGLIFNDDTIYPAANGYNGSDATTKLGSPSYRFKDLYLSGGVYLGGTGSANYLDDYESGTFTPTFTASTTNPTCTYDVQNGSYVKVGDLVFVIIELGTDAVSGGSGTLYISGLPFTSKAGIVVYNQTTAWNWGDNPVTSLVTSSVAYIQLWDSGTVNITTADMSTGANRNRIRLAFSYQTA